ncbi:MAG: bifunctional nuclease family protein [Thermodesulfobacteriota bacterium]
MSLEMKVAGLTVDPFSNMPIVILKDLEEKNTIPIWIGILEASAIATELEKIRLARPMTHDLLKNLLDSLGVEMLKIVVTDLRDNTFFAAIHLLNDKDDIILDARPSDAIALALRTGSPIFVEEQVLEKSKKIDLSQRREGEGTAETEKWKEILESLSPEDFGKYKM